MQSARRKPTVVPRGVINRNTKNLPLTSEIFTDLGSGSINNGMAARPAINRAEINGAHAPLRRMHTQRPDRSIHNRAVKRPSIAAQHGF